MSEAQNCPSELNFCQAIIVNRIKESLQSHQPRINVCKQIKLVNNAVLHNIFSLRRDLFFYTIIPEPLYEISTSDILPQDELNHLRSEAPIGLFKVKRDG